MLSDLNQITEISKNIAVSIGRQAKEEFEEDMEEIIEREGEDSDSSSSSSSSFSSSSSDDEKLPSLESKQRRQLVKKVSYTSLKSVTETDGSQNYSDAIYDDDIDYNDEFGLESINEKGPDLEDFDELQEDVENEERGGSSHGRHRRHRRAYRDDKLPFVLEVSTF